MIHMAGAFDVKPVPVLFDLLFTLQNGQWLLFGLSVGLAQPAPQAAAPATPAPTSAPAKAAETKPVAPAPKTAAPAAAPKPAAPAPAAAAPKQPSTKTPGFLRGDPAHVVSKELHAL
jgi:predicted lipid-binding transport protein (Tim44 family)